MSRDREAPRLYRVLDVSRTGSGSVQVTVDPHLVSRLRLKKGDLVMWKKDRLVKLKVTEA